MVAMGGVAWALRELGCLTDCHSQNDSTPAEHLVIFFVHLPTNFWLFAGLSICDTYHNEKAMNNDPGPPFIKPRPI